MCRHHVPPTLCLPGNGSRRNYRGRKHRGCRLEEHKPSHGHRRGTGLSQADRLMLLSRLPSAVAAAQQEPSPPTTRLVNLHGLPLRELLDRSAFRGQVAGVHTGRYTEPTRLPIHEVDLG